jgi:pyruvate dehydrogenase kinase 2/3/4
VIKVADEGGGIRRSYMNRIWSYLFTTADPAVQKGFVELAPVESDHGKESPLAGLGYGLPISRSYARYVCT